MRLFIKDIPSELVEKGKCLIQRYLRLNVLRFMLDGIDKSGELWHHGVKGQKWGVRNGPPYPLDENSKSPGHASERDIAKQKSSSLRKGIRNLEGKTALHIEKIKDPAKYCDAWDTYNEERKAGLIKHWNYEIQVFQKNIQNRIDELKKRGEWE